MEFDPFAVQGGSDKLLFDVRTKLLGHKMIVVGDLKQWLLDHDISWTMRRRDGHWRLIIPDVSHATFFKLVWF